MIFFPRIIIVYIYFGSFLIASVKSGSQNLAAIPTARFFVDQCQGWGLFSGDFLCSRTCNEKFENKAEGEPTNCVLDRTLKLRKSFYSFHCQCKECPSHKASSAGLEKLGIGDLASAALSFSPLSVTCDESEFCPCPQLGRGKNYGFVCSIKLPIPQIQNPYVYCTCCNDSE